MPLYDFKCLDCGEQFEALVLKNEPSCPACQGHRLEQLISMFSVDSASIRQSNINSARKANVKVARDKAVADREAIEHHDD
ncbi:MAG TPA: zinc ribbon domain-containing protein [Bryobacteraceae bacterium]|nr:zinc ribbon domain-containing protein [Bryobacteraceae bacterium]